MAALAQQRCLLHPDREAVSRCPSCRNDYCRECVTEYEGRIICASCLKNFAREAAHTAPPRSWGLTLPLLAFAGLVTAFFVFYALGQLLLLFPDTTRLGLTLFSPGLEV